MSKNDRISYNYLRYSNDRDTLVIEKYINGKFECEYRVKKDECTCPGFVHRGTCKHLSGNQLEEKILPKAESRSLIADAYTKLRSLYTYVEFMGHRYPYKDTADKVSGLFFECDKPIKEILAIDKFVCNNIEVLINSRNFFEDEPRDE